jgi:hypothetical protein
MPGPSKRPLGRLLLLAFLFVAALVYHIRVTMYREPHWFGIDAVQQPFSLAEPGWGNHTSGHNLMGFYYGNALKAGLQNGDA